MSELLNYPMRRQGMDHDRYDWSMLSQRPPVTWPGGKKLALWVNVNLQFFPLNPLGQPVKIPGNMTMPYPDLRHFSLRDYGNRVGLFRILNALQSQQIKPSFAVNGQLAQRVPQLLELAASTGEIIAHSWNMDTAHAGGLSQDDEAELIERTLKQLREQSGQAVTGWLSPGKQQSENTPDLLKAAGIEFMCDWVNDDMPYRFNTSGGSLWSLPLSTELEDRFVIGDNLHPAWSWGEQIEDAADLLLAEARKNGGRILALNLHPWVIGQPHRICYLEQALAHIMKNDDVWLATPSQIIAEVQQQSA